MMAWRSSDVIRISLVQSGHSEKVKFKLILKELGLTKKVLLYLWSISSNSTIITLCQA